MGVAVAVRVVKRTKSFLAMIMPFVVIIVALILLLLAWGYILSTAGVSDNKDGVLYLIRLFGCFIAPLLAVFFLWMAIDAFWQSHKQARNVDSDVFDSAASWRQGLFALILALMLGIFAAGVWSFMLAR
jgi:hypothetical protein